MPPEIRDPHALRDDGMPEGRRWGKGVSPNPGGRPKKLVELEREIREIHGPKALEVLERLYGLAMGTYHAVKRTRHGEQVFQLPPDSLAAKLYLERVLGPPRIAADDWTAAEGSEIERELCRALGVTPEQVKELREAA